MSALNRPARQVRILTIRVVVMTLAMPKPWGTMSNHRCHQAVSPFQKTSIEAAITVMKQDTNVKVYSLPVRRMTLDDYCLAMLATSKQARKYGPSGKHTASRDGYLSNA